MSTRRIRCDITIREPITVVRLLAWVYRDQKADLMSGKGLHGLEAGADGRDGGSFGHGSSCVATVEMNGLLGTIIRSTAWQQRPSLHPDAERVHDLVMGMPWAMAGLLIRNGKAGSEPDWGAREQRLEPIIQKGGHIVDYAVAEVVEVCYGSRNRRSIEVCYCPVMPYPSDESIAAMREVYGMWHDGLSRVFSTLSDPHSLARWEVTGIGAKAEPWM